MRGEQPRSGAGRGNCSCLTHSPAAQEPWAEATRGLALLRREGEWKRSLSHFWAMLTLPGEEKMKNKHSYCSKKPSCIISPGTRRKPRGSCSVACTELPALTCANGLGEEPGACPPLLGSNSHLHGLHVLAPRFLSHQNPIIGCQHSFHPRP